ncbi:MFS transporter [Georgenia alba]|uniref:MFS transporter n=1 Tax=Georgenia alba TaxID=2233858 RepID=A0ABW2Q7X1_9MICO
MSVPTAAPPRDGFRTFLHVLVNTGAANVTTSFVWFALTFWIYLETRSVLATGVIGGAYMLFISLFSMAFGSLVDRHRKKAVMVWATVVAFIVFVLDAVLFFAVGEDAVGTLAGPWFWLFATSMLAGSVVVQLRGIALSTTVTLLVPEERRANANGLVGTVQGLTFLVTSVFSGLAIGLLGMGPTLVIGTAAMGVTLVHLALVRIPEPQIVQSEGQAGWNDVRIGWRAVRSAPGLLALVLFTTLNNLLGGVYMALMDPYGLTLFSPEMWGVWLAVASTGFMVGGGVIAKFGLGRNPVRTMLVVAAVMGGLGGVFTLREWGWLFVVGMFLWMALMPAVESAEQTVIQKVVPYEKQGRVFGFAMTFEAAAAPVTAFLVAPIAEYLIIPYMETPAARADWAWLLGAGDARGMALIFLVTGALGVLLALGALRTPAYRRISRRYAEAPEQEPPGDDGEAPAPEAGLPGPAPDSVALVSVAAARQGGDHDGSAVTLETAGPTEEARS